MSLRFVDPPVEPAPPPPEGAVTLTVRLEPAQLEQLAAAVEPERLAATVELARAFGVARDVARSLPEPRT